MTIYFFVSIVVIRRTKRTLEITSKTNNFQSIILSKHRKKPQVLPVLKVLES